VINTRDLFLVYFMKPIALDGPIKIGLSGNPRERLRTSAAWSPFPLEVIGAVPGRWIDEQFLHECLADHHFHGEWFHAAPLVREAVEMVLSTGGFENVRAALAPLRNIRTKAHRATLSYSRERLSA